MNEFIEKNFYNLFANYIFSKTFDSFLSQKNELCDQKDIDLIGRMFRGKFNSVKISDGCSIQPHDWTRIYLRSDRRSSVS